MLVLDLEGMTFRLTKEVGDGQDAQGDGDSSCQHHLTKSKGAHNSTGLACNMNVAK